MTNEIEVIKAECESLGKPFFDLKSGAEGGEVVPFIAKEKDGKVTKFGGVAQIPTLEEAITINRETINEWYLSKVVAKIKANVNTFCQGYSFADLFTSQRGGELSPAAKALNAFIKAVTARIKQAMGDKAAYLTADIVRNSLYSRSFATDTYAFDQDKLISSCEKIGESLGWKADGIDFGDEFAALVANRETNIVNRVVKGNIELSDIDCEF